jgi:hypothetical protein
MQCTCHPTSIYAKAGIWAGVFEVIEDIKEKCRMELGRISYNKVHIFSVWECNPPSDPTILYRVGKAKFGNELGWEYAQTQIRVIR